MQFVALSLETTRHIAAAKSTVANMRHLFVFAFTKTSKNSGADLSRSLFLQVVNIKLKVIAQWEKHQEHPSFMYLLSISISCKTSSVPFFLLKDCWQSAVSKPNRKSATITPKPKHLNKSRCFGLWAKC